MKQIFDWMRNEVLDEALIDGEMHSTDNVFLSLHDIAEIINEAEAKWEADCCEWKGFDNSLIEGKVMWTYETTCKKYIPEERTSKYFRFCPYCGKPIKISEVE